MTNVTLPIRSVLFAAVIIGCLLVLVYLKNQNGGALTNSDIARMLKISIRQRPNDFSETANSLMQKQRNDLSKQANLLMQRFMKYDCDMKKKTGAVEKKDKVSISGGFCQDAGKKNSGQHIHDNKLIAYLSDLFQGKAVGSFGEGPGEYRRLLLATGKLTSYTGYDGSPYASENSDGTVEYLDLTIDAFGLPAFDWILSLEVAEHIPKEFENTFLRNIVRHAKEGVVMSWGKPGQGGLHHVNNRPLSYIIQTMESLGFAHDLEASKAVQAACSISWLRDNTNVYRRKVSNPLVYDQL